MEALLDKRAFVGLDSATWLYSGAETPPLRGGIEALEQYMNNRAMGPGGRDENASVELACKEKIAAMLQGKPEQIAFLSNASEIISTIARSLELQPGDNVVLHTLEFPSGVLPWLALKEKGVEVRVVNHQRWTIGAAEVLDQVDDRTRMVITSHVSYLSGARIDYKALYEKLVHTDTLLLLDATQSLGVIPVDMNEADLVVCSSYKWLLSIHGLGILAVNPKRTGGLESRSLGWRSVSDMFGPDRFASYTLYPDARQFETGYPSFAAIYTLNYSAELLLGLGAARIEQHILDLGDELIEQLTSQGYEVMTPRDRSKRCGNICLVAEEGEKIAEALRSREIYVWGGDGRLRASIHVFNDSADIARFAELLPAPKSKQRS